ncbi:hypothetical protein E4K10_42200 [Streptomyces sp. T1317-0309]|nr:hypothetical protein E4K10_42200 [Streptomyces sp. T1317-0309]
MTDLDGPHQLLVRARWAADTLHTTGESGRVDLGAFTRALLLADPSLDLDDGLAGRLEAWAQARPTAGTARSELLRHAGEGLSWPSPWRHVSVRGGS